MAHGTWHMANVEDWGRRVGMRPTGQGQHESYESWTHSLPLVRPSRASGYAQMELLLLPSVSQAGIVAIATCKPFATSQVAQVVNSRSSHSFFECGVRNSSDFGERECGISGKVALFTQFTWAALSGVYKSYDNSNNITSEFLPDGGRAFKVVGWSRLRERGRASFGVRIALLSLQICNSAESGVSWWRFPILPRVDT